MKRYNKVMHYIRESLRNPGAYSEEEITFMRDQLKLLEDEKQSIKKEKNRGFGS
jgi:uncharacterized protein YydD (DUF2326 family)